MDFWPAHLGGAAENVIVVQDPGHDHIPQPGPQLLPGGMEGKAAVEQQEGTPHLCPPWLRPTLQGGEASCLPGSG